MPVIKTFLLPFVITNAFPNAKLSSSFFLSLSTSCFAHSKKNGKNLVMLIYVLFFNFYFLKTNITRSCGHELYSVEVMDDKIHRLAHEYYKLHG